MPADPERLAQDCYEAYNIQVAGLAQRLEAIGVKRVVIGVSGGLDSTQALIVAAKAFDRLESAAGKHPRLHDAGLRHERRHQGQRASPDAGAGRYRTRARHPPGGDSRCSADMEHPFARGEAVYDVTFENVQAGLRTDYLFRLANQHGGIVIGTGDLSELALGWCTYGVGDQMAHYNVNSGVPKTLIQHLIRWVIASRQFDEAVGETLDSILDTEITPELVPVVAGETPQSTEAKVGPYELQDFNLFYTARYGFRPSKIAFLALHAWGDKAKGEWPAGFPQDRRQRLRPRDHQELAPRVPAALLRLQPVQALGHAERPESVGGRRAVAAWRLARAVRRQRPCVARRARCQRA